MATFNGEKYISEQLQSFSEQALLPDELVICDDGSTDQTINILKEFSKSAPFVVKIFTNDINIGYPQNFSKALSLTHGDYIFLSDQDDVWFPDKIVYIINYFIRHPDCQLVIHDCELTNSTLLKTGLTKFGQMKSLGLAASQNVTGCCTATTRSFLDLVMPIPQLYAHDNWLHEIASDLGVRQHSEKILMYYRRHSANSSSSFLANKPEKIDRLTLLRNILANAFTLTPANHHLALLKLGTRIQMLENIYKFSPIWMNSQIFTNNMRNLKKSMSALSARSAIISEPRHARFAKILRALKLGYYNAFSGLASALKDLLSHNQEKI